MASVCEDRVDIAQINNGAITLSVSLRKAIERFEVLSNRIFVRIPWVSMEQDRSRTLNPRMKEWLKRQHARNMFGKLGAIYKAEAGRFRLRNATKARASNPHVGYGSGL